MAKRQFEPMLTRWTNLADTIRRTKGNIDFGEIDPKLTAAEQRADNEVAQEVEQMITEMRALATELGTFFDIYVEEEIQTGVEKALGDKETFQKMVALLIKEGKLDHGALAGLGATEPEKKEATPEKPVEKLVEEKPAEDKKPNDHNGNNNQNKHNNY